MSDTSTCTTQVLRFQACATLPSLCGVWEGTRDLMCVKLALYQLSYLPHTNVNFTPKNEVNHTPTALKMAVTRE